MAADTFDRSQILAFLTRLETQARSIDAVSQEWESALALWPGQADDSSSRARFQEWFLLERKSIALGAPPLLALAPEDGPEIGAWETMFAAYLGIFQALGTDDTGFPTFEDLWSGRQIRLDQELPGETSGLLLYGYVAEVDGEHHAPLPGACLLAGGSLADALAGDLSRIRAQQPGGRLSLRSCEEILQRGLANEADTPVPAEDRNLQIETMLASSPRWTVDSLHQSIAAIGVAATMDRLAFETELDLEALRRLLPTIAAEGQPAEENANLNIPQALEVFDQARQQGLDLDTAFKELEHLLQLEESTQELEPEEAVLKTSEKATGMEMGAHEVPGMAFWLQCARWEREQDPSLVGLATPDQAVEDAWITYLESTHEQAMDPHQLSAQDVLSFLIQSANLEELQHRHHGLFAFLHWLQREQNCEIPSWLVDPQTESTELAKLQAVVRMNQQGRASTWQADAMARVTQLDPLQVRAEEEEARVRGLDEDFQAFIEAGDHLTGRWRQGHFEAQGWIPAAWLPQASEESSQA